jgi:predicted extracellular nuclease
MSRKTFMLATALTLVMACGGRTTSGGTDTSSLPDTKIDVVYADNGPDGAQPDGTVNPESGIEKIQKNTNSVDCPADSKFGNFDEGLQIQAVVTGPKFEASAGKLDGYFIATPGVATTSKWNGIELVVDVAQATAFKVGDTLTITGQHVEYYCNTQLDATSVAATGTGAVPAALEIDPADLGSQDKAKAEALEGVLVKVKNVSVTNANPDAPNDYGSFQVTGGLLVGDLYKPSYSAKDTDQRKVGDMFAEITGIVSYSFGAYYLNPRSDADLVFGVVPPVETSPEVVDQDVPVTQDTTVVETITTDTTPGTTKVYDIQSSEASAACTADGSQTIQESVALADVVVTTPKYIVNGGNDGYYVSDLPVGGSADFTGAMLMVPNTIVTNFVPGDVVRIVGKHIEYYCFTEIVATSVEKVGTDTAPEPVVVADPSALESGGKAAAEPLEGVIVTLTGITVTNTTPEDAKSWFEIGNGIQVANDFKVAFTAEPGQVLTSITGAIKWNYGKFRLVPRTAADIVALETPVEPNPETVPDVIEPVDAGQDAGIPDVPAEDPGVTPDPGTSTDVPVAPTAYVYELQSAASSKDCTSGGSNATLADPYPMPRVVITTGKYTINSSYIGYYAADPEDAWATAGDPLYHGIALVFANADDPALVPGDLVSLEGAYKEYYCFTEIQAKAVAKIGSAPVPAVTSIDKALLESGGTAALEPYESLVVKITDVEITDAAGGSQPKHMFKAGNGIYVADDFGTGYTPVMGTKLSSITGGLLYTYGKWVLAPRTLADIAP